MSRKGGSYGDGSSWRNHFCAWHSLDVCSSLSILGSVRASFLRGLVPSGGYRMSIDTFGSTGNASVKVFIDRRNYLNDTIGGQGGGASSLISALHFGSSLDIELNTTSNAKTRNDVSRVKAHTTVN